MAKLRNVQNLLRAYCAVLVVGVGEEDGVLVVKGAVCEMGECVTNHVQKLSLSLHDVRG